MSNDPIRDAIRRAHRSLANDLNATPESLQRAILDGVGEIAGVIVATNEEPPRGPFCFYEATPITQTPEQRELIIKQAMETDTRLTREDAEAAIDACANERLVISTEYQIALREAETGFDHAVIHLSIKRLDREPIRDWRVLQQIKNAIVGEECEAFEIFPAESRLVDTANQYHLWAFVDPRVRVPVGFINRLVDVMPLGRSVQRRFEAPDALWPSKAQLVHSLRVLSLWMRDNTGPRDGTLDMLKNAVALLDQVDRAERIADKQRAETIAQFAKEAREAVLPDELRAEIERVGVDQVVAAARHQRLKELQQILADDPTLDSVTDEHDFRKELAALEEACSAVPWCEHCQCWHHPIAAHIPEKARVKP